MTEKIIIDAENAVLGRLASYAAKQLLKGYEIEIVNSEKAIILGSEKNILERYKRIKARGGSALKGPHFPAQPEKILKRTIRGMLPYRQSRGKEALKRVKCYISVPEKLKDKKMIKSARGKRGISLGYLAKMLGGLFR